jgi:hypothetical protein
MSIEQRLTDELKRQGKSIQCPAAVGIRTEQLFDQRFSGKLSTGNLTSVFARPRRYSQAVIIALCLLLFSGIAYASTLLYQLNDGSFSFQVSSNTHKTLDDQQAQVVRERINQVRQQLASGESAMVYVPELNKLKLPPLVKVNQPLSYTSIEGWLQQLVGSAGAYKLPDKLPEGFAFTEGRTVLPIGAINADILRDNLETLKKQSKDGTAGITWKKFDADGTHAQSFGAQDIPNLIYQNAKGDQIQIYYQLIPDSEKVKTVQAQITGIEQVEKVSLNGKEAYYSVNNHAFLSPSNQSQALTWIGQDNGQIVLYSVLSESVGVSKQDLVFTAEHMK